MLCFPTMLLMPAAKAGMKVPSLEGETFDSEEFPHFAVFCSMQLGVPMGPLDHWKNAEVIAAIPDDNIKKVTPEDVVKLGFISWVY